MPSRSKLWLTEQSCVAISEVFTRAITVIIISTIPCNALSWNASLAPGREVLPASGFWDFVNCSSCLGFCGGARREGREEGEERRAARRIGRLAKQFKGGFYLPDGSQTVVLLT